MAETKAATKNYDVLTNLRHDGKGYAPGSTVKLTDEDAAPLLKRKVVEPEKPKEKAK